jgi:hypothetical protein
MNAASLLRDQQRVAPQATRAELRQALRSALINGAGLAVGKLGLSEQALLAYPLLLRRCRTTRQEAAITAQTRHHCAVQMGVFPNHAEAMLAFSALHAEATRALDLVGLVGGRLEADLLAELRLPGQTLSILELEPDRSRPDRSEHCYLPELAGRRVLIVSSIAELLCSRAQRSIFEAVWAKTGKPWFAPAEMLPLQFPYTYDVDTQRRFGSSQRLLEWIVEEIHRRSFDVALIAASHLGIPIAAEIKGINRCALALGGALQVLFGVGGERWWSDPVWHSHYINEAWIRVPTELMPRVAGAYVDGGAYW